MWHRVPRVIIKHFHSQAASIYLCSQHDELDTINIAFMQVLSRNPYAPFPFAARAHEMTLEPGVLWQDPTVVAG
eukprot:14152760-Heterocapsa_arctica.AAC.1